RAGNDGHGVDLLGVGDELAAGLEVLRPAGRLQQLEGEDEVRLALVDDGGVDLVPPADVGDHAAAPLAHAVDLADLHVVAGGEQHPSQELAGQEGALTAHADDHDVLRFHNSKILQLSPVVRYRAGVYRLEIWIS